MLNEVELLKEYGSPLYVLHEDILNRQCEKMKAFENELLSSLPNDIKISMHYAIKSNNNPAVLKAVQKYGLKVDSMSPTELYINERCGFNSEDILYVCNNIDAEEMKVVHNRGILICLDSISQVDTWGKMFPGTSIMVRINPGVVGVGHSEKVITSGNSTKFGICEDNLPELFKVCQTHNLRIIGTHQHLGSLFLNDKIDNYIAGVHAGLDIIKKYFKDLEIIDLGGGFGVPYKPGETDLSLSEVANKLGPVLNEFISEYPSVKEFKFEPGRYIPCEAEMLIGTVTAVKHEYGTWWIGTDIGMNQLVRPSMYDSYHEIALPFSNGESVHANFCGNICESGDILGKDRLVNLPKVGDPVVVYNAGAYGYSMASNYTGRERPAEVMIKTSGETTLIRKRESIKDLTNNIIW